MRPPNDVEFPIIDLLQHRWSPRAFADRRVEQDALRSCLEAARWAPSSSNGQPWNFIVSTKDDPADFERMLNCLAPGNVKWAKEAPVLVAAVASTFFAHNGKPNRHALYDTGTAVAMLTVQATALGLYVHQMAGFEPDKVRQAYAVPPSAEPITMFALGYLGDANGLPDDLRQRELAAGERKRLLEFVYAGAWGRTMGG